MCSLLSSKNVCIECGQQITFDTVRHWLVKNGRWGKGDVGKGKGVFKAELLFF